METCKSVVHFGIFVQLVPEWYHCTVNGGSAVPFCSQSMLCNTWMLHSTFVHLVGIMKYFCTFGALLCMCNQQVLSSTFVHSGCSEVPLQLVYMLQYLCILSGCSVVSLYSQWVLCSAFVQSIVVDSFMYNRSTVSLLPPRPHTTLLQSAVGSYYLCTVCRLQQSASMYSQRCLAVPCNTICYQY